MIVTAVARRHLQQIHDYGTERWGAIRAEAYIASFERRFVDLMRNPGLGSWARDFGEGIRSFPHEAHHIVYRVRFDALEILGVPHQSVRIRRFR